ncbi:MAG: ABC transporter permease [Ktedonobacteraceae bacterium]|nr:ABC transporter permease [Ktedonobacteraceae bacterium]
MKSVLRLVGSWDVLLVLLLVIVLGTGSSLSPYFLVGSNFTFLISDSMERAIMALPMMLIIVTGEIDLSVASTLGLASSVLGLLVGVGLPLWLGIVVVLLVGVACGLVNGLLITRLGLPSLVVTLGTLALYRGLSYVVLGSNAISNFPIAFTSLGLGTIPGTIFPWSFLIFAVLALLCLIVLHFSWIGRQLYAIGNNKDAALFAGIRVARVKLLLYMLSGLFSALAGIIFTARFSSARADNALGFELDVVTIVLLGGVSIFGGKGTLPGVLLSLFVVAGLRNALGLIDVTSDVQSIIIGILLIVSVLGPNLVQRIQTAFSIRPRSARQ